MESAVSHEILKNFLDAVALDEMPFAVFSTDREPESGFTPRESGKSYSCVMSYISRARKHQTAAYFSRDQEFCPGGRLYLNVIDEIPELIAPYVSTGIPLQLIKEKVLHKDVEVMNCVMKTVKKPFNSEIKTIIRGERISRTPEIVQHFLETVRLPPDMNRYRVFKPLNLLEEGESPEIVVFFTTPDVLSALYNLVQYYTGKMDSVTAPWGAGCTSLYAWPIKFSKAGEEKAVLGGFDVIARPFLGKEELTLSMPFAMFQGILACYEDSFLFTKSWKMLKKRIDRESQAGEGEALRI